MSENDSVFDIGDEDEPFIMADHQKIWSGRMGLNDVEDLSKVSPVSFEENIRVALWDRDAGYSSNEDDPIGDVVIHASQKGHGELTHSFKGRRAKYTLNYKVE